eukprot:CAMPEP_0119377246 /NCGR_PEP_ID=MMETSP1334-20130426/43896_1 /TAXON_ID=127549 /ORGANISM="Calcidiscus leptoporus, Strain RCC1130" /LENGTH=31 /DNA_ID= /DNA_START= /DNA_END= /DNA_ORIENTATION=
MEIRFDRRRQRSALSGLHEPARGGSAQAPPA